MAKKTKEQWLIIAAFLTVYFVWGSTYLANYLAIQGIPTFFMSATRFLTAGSILFVINRIIGYKIPNRGQILRSMGTGVLLLSVGTGLVVWSEHYIDTGLAALIVAFEPLLVVLLVWWMHKSRPKPSSIIGIAFGVVGMGLLVGQDTIKADINAIWGVAAISIAILSWAFAAIYSSRADLPKPATVNACYQMLGGGITLLVVSTILGEWQSFDPTLVPSKTWMAWGYLVFFGSIITFTAFNYLIVTVPPHQVATTNFVNPVVALGLGTWLNNEPLNNQSILAAGILLTGVIFINDKVRFFKQKPKLE